jgi:signal peptidase I
MVHLEWITLQAIFVITVLIALCAVRLVVRHTRDLSPATRDTLDGLLRDIAAVVAFVYFLLRPFVVQTCWIPSESMLPTLVEGDRVLVNSWIYRYLPPRRADVMVFHPPPAAAARPEDLTDPTDYVKRLIGLPAETVRTDKDGTVHVNGRPLVERYIGKERHGTYKFPECVTDGGEASARPSEFVTELGETFKLDVAPSPDAPGRLETTVPEGQYFVLGDNRDSSDDGHRWGYLPADATVGRVSLVFWPPKRIGLVH